MSLRIHFHTDSATFAGCEQMLTLLLPALAEATGFKVSLSYRYSEAYETGFRERVGDVCPVTALRLPEVADLEARVKRRLPGAALRPVRGLVWGVLHVLPLRQVFQIYDLAPLRKVFLDARPDIIHINNGGFPGAGSANAAAIAARGRGVVYVVNNLAYGYGNPLRWADFPIDRMAARATTRFVTGSNAAALRLRSVLGLSEGDVEVIPNSIKPRRADETPDETRARLGIGPGDLLFACIARLEKRKGHRVLIDAAAELRPVSPDRRIVIAFEGDGPERGAIEAAIGRSRGPVEVHLIGTESNVWNLLQAADAVVLPSVGYEDFPNVILEAMSLGKPVVASRVGGITEQVVDGATGFVVPPNDSAALASALGELVSDDSRMRSMGEGALTHYRRQFAPELVVERYMRLYREIAGA